MKNMKRQRETPLVLFEHQVEGVERILSAWCSSARALLLHDEMGLGKTIQALEALRRMLETGRLPPECPHLVVAPAACLHVWQAEVERWFAPAGVFRDTRIFSGHTATAKTLERCTSDTLVLVSYTTLRNCFHTFLENNYALGAFKNGELARLCAASGKLNNMEHVDTMFKQGNRHELLKLMRALWTVDRRRGPSNAAKNSGYDTLARTDYGCVVMDEVHMIKNASGKTCRAVAFLSACCRLGLSGTPMMNHGGELLTIIRYGLAVRNVDWPRVYREPNGDYTRALLSRVCFGRRKRDVKSMTTLLPQRGTVEEEQLLLEWDDNTCARDMYVQIRSDSLKAAEAVKTMRRAGGEGKAEFQERRAHKTRHFWTQFQNLRNLCLHHFLLCDENYDVPLLRYSRETAFAFPAWLQEKCLTTSLCLVRLGVPERVRDCINNWLCRAERYTVNASPKMRVFWDILQRGKKVVAISQRRQFLEHILGPWLARNSVQYVLFAGGSKASQRDALAAFHSNDAIRVLMVVKTAGAHGLNLQHDASTVVLFDPHFNEALDEQSVQRVDRIGQRDRRLTIRKLYMRGSVDEAMRAMQVEKNAHTQAWLGRSNNRLTLDTVELFLANYDSVGKQS